jgi:hypothetical protein
MKKPGSRKRDRGDLPPANQVAYPESEFSRFQRAKIVEVDQARREHEQKWGVNRISTLVPTEFREKFYAQSERVWAAQEAKDVQRFAAACDGMLRAYKAMDAWATAEGIAPALEVHRIEAQTDLGLMVIVKDETDANRYMEMRKDVLQVWTVAEVTELLKAGIGQAIWELKAKLPMRGQVVAVQTPNGPLAKPAAWGASGFDDMQNDLDMNAPDGLPKMFTAPHGRLKDKEGT